LEIQRFGTKRPDPSLQKGVRPLFGSQAIGQTHERLYTHEKTPAREGVRDERPVAASGAAVEHPKRSDDVIAGSEERAGNSERERDGARCHTHDPQHSCDYEIRLEHSGVVSLPPTSRRRGGREEPTADNRCLGQDQERERIERNRRSEVGTHGRAECACAAAARAPSAGRKSIRAQHLALVLTDRGEGRESARSGECDGRESTTWTDPC